MGEQKNTITINGKIYDASTGAEAYGHAKHKNAGSSAKHTKTMDGFFRHTPPPQHPPAKTVHKPTAKEVEPTKHRPPAHNARAIHKKPEHANTLMRSSVAKPKNAKPVAVSGHLEPDESILSSDEIAQPLTAHGARSKRARSVPKSHLVRRFHHETVEPTLVKSTAAIKVKSHPAEPISQHYEPAIQESIQPEPSEDIFATALSNAKSHEQKPPKHSSKNQRTAKKLKVSTKALNIGASVLIIVALAGFVAYQNLANISMRVAVAKAGVSASLPGYNPSGFALSRNIQTSPGQVVINFSSNSDNRKFSISQTASDWNSQSLLDNYVATTDQPYQQLSQSDGKTVFVYGNSNATWVDGGIWYKIEGNSSLASDQLLKIANSF